jgi:peptidoglycan biosynthesis protein MviN/MurJ (putative lipid II flippase)
MAVNRPRGLAARSLANIIVRTAAIVVGFLTMGITGLLIGRTISGIVFAIFSLSLAARITGSHPMAALAAAWRSFVAVLAMSVVLMVLPHPPWSTLGWSAMLLYTAGHAIAGAAIYLALHILLWRAAGCPAGAERLIVKQVSRLLARRSPGAGGI